MCLCRVTCVSGSALPWIEAELGCVPCPSTADASEMMFSVESLFFGAGDSESCFSLVLNTSSLEQEASRQPCGLLEPLPFLNLGPVFIPCIFFLSLPACSAQDVVPALPAQPHLLYRGFSEPLPRSLGYSAPFGRGDVATRGCASRFSCTEFEVICSSVSKHTCFWSQHINMIYFQF